MNAKRARSLVLVAAIVLGWLIVMIELGVAIAPGLSDLVGAPLQAVPGIGIPALVLVDIPLAFTLTLFGLGFVVPHGLLGRTQGCATLIVSLVVLLGGCLTVVLAFGLLMVMLALIGSFFGIVVYLALWGNFAREAAAVILAFLLMSKLVIGAGLLVSNQRYLQNRGLVLLWLTSLVANVIVAFLHGLLPRPVVSILDAVAAIILADPRDRVGRPAPHRRCHLDRPRPSAGQGAVAGARPVAAGRQRGRRALEQRFSGHIRARLERQLGLDERFEDRAGLVPDGHPAARRPEAHQVDLGRLIGRHVNVLVLARVDILLGPRWLRQLDAYAGAPVVVQGQSADRARLRGDADPTRESEVDPPAESIGAHVVRSARSTGGGAGAMSCRTSGIPSGETDSSLRSTEMPQLPTPKTRRTTRTTRSRRGTFIAAPARGQRDGLPRPSPDRGRLGADPADPDAGDLAIEPLGARERPDDVDPVEAVRHGLELSASLDGDRGGVDDEGVCPCATAPSSIDSNVSVVISAVATSVASSLPPARSSSVARSSMLASDRAEPSPTATISSGSTASTVWTTSHQGPVGAR